MKVHPVVRNGRLAPLGSQYSLAHRRALCALRVHLQNRIVQV